MFKASRNINVFRVTHCRGYEFSALPLDKLKFDNCCDNCCDNFPNRLSVEVLLRFPRLRLLSSLTSVFRVQKIVTVLTVIPCQLSSSLAIFCSLAILWLAGHPLAHRPTSRSPVLLCLLSLVFYLFISTRS